MGTARGNGGKDGWLLSAPALVILLVGAAGPLTIVAVYSFLTPGEYSGVVWQPSGDAWFRVFFERDIFDGTLGVADAHLTIFWRSVRLSLLTYLAVCHFGRGRGEWEESEQPEHWREAVDEGR